MILYHVTLKKIFILLSCSVVVLLSFCSANDEDVLGSDIDPEKYYTNGWAIKLKGDDTFERAKRIADKYGFDKVTKVGSLQGFYHLEHPHHPTRSKRSSESRTDTLLQDEEIFWAEQQHEYKREKRGLHHQHVVTRGIEPRFADPLWEEQWYLDDKRSQMDLDVNVIPVWKSGISGKGVVVTILDDGIEHNHTDLERNYDPAASWDVNDNDPDPFPRYDPTNENKHGTRCAGEVAAQANNSKCGVGVAFNARIGGVRMLDGRVTDRVEAESLSLNPQYIDIYSASWGPSDDGMTVEGPGTLASAAFLNGITKGRGGLGSIYIWASGNGGRHDDSCNCDGYTASIYTLSISSSSDHGESPWYSEACASTLATTLSSGAHGEKRIVTTDLHNQCTERHTGTSASAPLAGGIIALALEQNPKLTWRDVQHIVVHTANWIPLKRDPEWRMNGIGLHVNEKFGFGLLDADRIVQMANPETFKTVPSKKECKGKTFTDSRSLRWDQPLVLEIESDGCQHLKEEIRYLEHVQLVLSIEYTRRGDLTIFVTTPMGTRSVLLPVRSEDSSDEGFKRWAFMTTHAWGEDPRGIWTLEIKDGGESRTNTGSLRDWQLVLHGTKEKPHHQNITHPEIPIHRKAIPDDVKNNGKSSVQITQITYTFGEQTLPSQTILPPNEPFSQMFPNSLSLPIQQQQQFPSLTTNQNTIESLQNSINSDYSFNLNNNNFNPYSGSSIPAYDTHSGSSIPAYDTHTGSSIPAYDTNFNTNTNNYNNNNNANALANLLSSQTLAQLSKVQQQLDHPLSSVTQLSNIQAYQPGNNQFPVNMVGRSLGWSQSPSLQQLYPVPNANLWDFFGRMNSKRDIDGEDIIPSAKLNRKTGKKRNSLIEALEKMKNV